MRFVTGKEILLQALHGGYAVGAFNFTNMEVAQAVISAANDVGKPVMLQASSSAIKYMGFEYVMHIAQAAVETSKVPVCLHLDHGSDFDLCKTCIDNGFSSVMIDKSMESFEENVKATSAVVEYAHSKQCSVEAELGTLAGVEDDIDVDEESAVLTNAAQAKDFVNATGVDSLAVAIGTSHGPNKGNMSSPKLHIERLEEIHNAVGRDFPLVLHGASSVYDDTVQVCNTYGAEIRNAHGITDKDIKLAIKHGIAKINVDTDIRLAFLAGIRKTLRENKESIDMRKYIGAGREYAMQVIKRKILSFTVE